MSLDANIDVRNSADRTIYSTVKLVPVDRGGTVSLVPVLFYETSIGEYKWSVEALEFAYASERANSSGKVVSDIKALSRLLMFVGVVSVLKLIVRARSKHLRA